MVLAGKRKYGSNAGCFSTVMTVRAQIVLESCAGVSRSILTNPFLPLQSIQTEEVISCQRSAWLRGGTG